MYVSIPSLNLLATNITFSGTVVYLNSTVIVGSAIYITVQEDRRRTLNYRSDNHVRIVNGFFSHKGKEDKEATFNNINLYTRLIKEFFGNRIKIGTCFLLTKGSFLKIQAPANITFHRNQVFQSSGKIVAIILSSSSYNSCLLQFFMTKRRVV